MVELAREAAEAVPGMEERLKVRIDPSAEDAMVPADRARILQVFRNLFSNALKYSPPRTPVVLSVECDDGIAVRFSVENQGPGIDPESMPRLFQRFSRVRAAGMERVPGSGLGLYIARRIVEDHGGTIWAESEPGRTATFSFTLPTADSATRRRERMPE